MSKGWSWERERAQAGVRVHRRERGARPCSTCDTSLANPHLDAVYADQDDMLAPPVSVADSAHRGQSGWRTNGGRIPLLDFFSWTSSPGGGHRAGPACLGRRYPCGAWRRILYPGTRQLVLDSPWPCGDRGRDAKTGISRAATETWSHWTPTYRPILSAGTPPVQRRALDPGSLPSSDGSQPSQGHLPPTSAPGSERLPLKAGETLERSVGSP